MPPIELTDKPKLDVVLFVSLSGLEIATELPAEAPELEYQRDWVLKVKSYNTKRMIYVIIANMVLIERLSESEYLINVAKAREQATRERLGSQGAIMPVARIPGIRLH